MLSDRILALRKSKNISQEKMAELFSVSRQAIQKWEQGAAVPELDKLLAMAKHFDVSLDYLVGGVDRRDTEELRLDRNILPSYYALHDWEYYAAGLETEFLQSMDEGLDVGRLEGLFKETAKLPSGPEKEAIADVLFRMVLNAKPREDYPYEDDCICTPDFTTDDYVRVTQLYYEGVVSRLVNSTLEQFLWHMY